MKLLMELSLATTITFFAAIIRFRFSSTMIIRGWDLENNFITKYSQFLLLLVHDLYTLWYPKNCYFTWILNFFVFVHVIAKPKWNKQSLWKFFVSIYIFISHDNGITRELVFVRQLFSTHTTIRKIQCERSLTTKIELFSSYLCFQTSKFALSIFSLCVAATLCEVWQKIYITSNKSIDNDVNNSHTPFYFFFFFCVVP